MATSEIEKAAGALLRAWGDGPAPASNCAGVISELRRVYAAEVEAREQARIEAYRAAARELAVYPDAQSTYASLHHKVDTDDAVALGTLAGDSGAWVTIRVFIKDVDTPLNDD